MKTLEENMTDWATPNFKISSHSDIISCHTKPAHDTEKILLHSSSLTLYKSKDCSFVSMTITPNILSSLILYHRYYQDHNHHFLVVVTIIITTAITIITFIIIIIKKSLCPTLSPGLTSSWILRHMRLWKRG